MRRKENKSRNIIFQIICPILAMALIGIEGFLVYKYPTYKLQFIAGGIGLYLSLIVIFAIALGGGATKRGERHGVVLGNIMYDKINSLNEPALICDSSYKIIWANSFTSKAISVKSVLGSLVTSLFPYQISDEKLVKKNEEIRVKFANENYILEETRIDSGSERYYLLVLRNITTQTNLEQFIRDDEKVVAYVIVDNLDELLRFEHDRYREIAAKVESILKSWADSVNGLLKEYEKDKYLFIFNMEDLDKFVANNFEILDKIREIRVGSSSSPVTLSMGVAKVSGTMAEKEKAAHEALDTALQRGGDQAAVLIDDKLAFYGGRTNAIKSRTKVRARVIANELASRMANASNVLIMAHAFPDYDAIGASCGIARLAAFCGVKANVVTNFKEKNVKKCLKHLENDENYKGVFVSSTKAMDLVKSDTLLIIVDVNNMAMFESKDLARMVNDVIIIDHHRKTAESEIEPLFDYIDPSASSASEIVAEILEQGLPVGYLNQTDADMLYAGILLDTKHFTKGVGTKTYSASMYLRDHDASYENIEELFKTSIAEYKKEAKFGEKVEIYRNCMAIALSTNGQDSQDRIMAAKVADNLLMLEDVSASFALVKIGNTVHISARSNGTINVQLILEALNGGGRYDAAGAQVKDGDLTQTLLKLKHSIDNYINLEA